MCEGGVNDKNPPDRQVSRHHLTHIHAFAIVPQEAAAMGSNEAQNRQAALSHAVSEGSQVDEADVLRRAASGGDQVHTEGKAGLSERASVGKG